MSRATPLWAADAMRMQAEGRKIADIAKALEQKDAAVRNYLRRMADNPERKIEILSLSPPRQLPEVQLTGDQQELIARIEVENTVHKGRVIRRSYQQIDEFYDLPRDLLRDSEDYRKAMDRAQLAIETIKATKAIGTTNNLQLNDNRQQVQRFEVEVVRVDRDSPSP